MKERSLSDIGVSNQYKFVSFPEIRRIPSGSPEEGREEGRRAMKKERRGKGKQSWHRR